MKQKLTSTLNPNINLKLYFFFKEAKQKSLLFLFLLGIFNLNTSNIIAQTVIFGDDFNSGATNWTLNSGDVNSTPGAIDNRWVINNIYQGGFFGLIPNTPNQPANITGAPQSGFLHITSSFQGTVNNANFAAPADGNKFAKMTNGVSTIGFTNVSFGFWLLCNGDVAANNAYFGRTYYSIDGGNTWIQNPTTYSQISNWTQVSVTNPVFNNKADLRFAFMWVQNSSNATTATDPPFSVDEFVVSGNTSSTNSITTGTITGSPFCPGQTFPLTFTSTGLYNAGNIYTAQLSNSSGSFATSVNIGTTNSTLNSGSISVTIPSGTTPGSGYQIRIISSNPSTTGSSSTAFTVNNAIVPIAVTPAGPITLCQGQSVTLSAATGLTSYVWSPGNIAGQNLTVTAAGTYTVNAQTAQGCPAASAQVVVTLSNTVQPIAVTPAGPITLCQGQSVTLSAAAGLISYLWTPGNVAGQNLTVTAAGTYSVTAQTAQGCPAASSQVVVTVSNEVQAIAITPVGPISICPGQTTTLNAEAGFNSYVWSGGAGSGQSITVSTAGNYSVTATTAQGCPAASATVIVTVDNNQTFTLVENGPTALCNGEQLILSVPTGFTGVNWSNAATSNSITVTAPGSFSATATSASGCASTSNTVEVTSGSAPVASFTAEQINNFNTIFTNTSNGGSTYFWNFGNGNTSTGQNATFNFNIEGNYTVSLIVTNACGSDTVTQQVAIIKLSINQIATQINLTVSPNPTQGEILISADLPGAEIIKTLIVNTLGQIVMTENWNYFPGSKYLVDVNRLAVGNYVLLLETSKGRAAKTIIKN